MFYTLKSVIFLTYLLVVVIRLQRTGRHNRPCYRVVVADSKSPVKGKFIENLGFYDPINKLCEIKIDKIKEWEKKGAKPSEAVASLIKREGKVELKKRTKPNKKSIKRDEEKKQSLEKAKEEKLQQQEAEKAEVATKEEETKTEIEKKEE